MNIFIKRQLLVCLFLSLMSVSAFAKTKVVVVPLLGGETKNISNIITVAKEGGDFTNPVDAINSISGANVNNQYLIYIAPGVYNLSTPLILKNFVHVQGAGSKMTEIVGAFWGCVVDGSTHSSFSGHLSSSISGLKIKNTGGAGISYSCGIKNIHAEVYDLDIHVFGSSTSNVGIDAVTGLITYKNIEIIIGSNSDSSAMSSTSNIGVFVGMYILADNLKITVAGKGKNYGILSDYSSGELKNLYIRAQQGVLGYGIKNWESGDVGFTIRDSYIRGSTSAISIGSSTGFEIYRSSLKGGLEKDTEGMARCFYSDDTSTELATDCSAPE